VECPAPNHAGTTLLIGCGNALRRDDGIGPHIAMVVERWKLPGVVTRAVFGLTPELAEYVAAARRVIFVDARLAMDESQRCEVRRLAADDHPTTLGHAFDPTSLLALAGHAYDRWPPALCVIVPAFDMSLGEGFSPIARRAIREALRTIAALF
jgi:hydrogenase maturation protease